MKKNDIKIYSLLVLFLFNIKIGITQNYFKVAEVISSGAANAEAGNYSNFGILGETLVSNLSSMNNYETSLGFLSNYKIKTNSIDLKNNTVINFYPNPTNNWLGIELQFDPKEYTIEFHNNLGQLKLQKKSTARIERINLEEWNSGIYYLRIFNEYFSKTEKIIVK